MQTNETNKVVVCCWCYQAFQKEHGKWEKGEEAEVRKMAGRPEDRVMCALCPECHAKPKAFTADLKVRMRRGDRPDIAIPRK